MLLRKLLSLSIWISAEKIWSASYAIGHHVPHHLQQPNSKILIKNLNQSKLECMLEYSYSMLVKNINKNSTLMLCLGMLKHRKRWTYMGPMLQRLWSTWFYHIFSKKMFTNRVVEAWIDTWLTDIGLAEWYSKVCLFTTHLPSAGFQAGSPNHNTSLQHEQQALLDVNKWDGWTATACH